MTAQIIDGKALAQRIQQQLAKGVQQRLDKGLHAPGLAVIHVGNDPASTIYVSKKREACKAVGFQSGMYDFPESMTELELIQLIKKLNQDQHTDGILVQLPLPGHIDEDRVMDAIDPAKDVDGFHAQNLGQLLQRRPHLRSCTPYGIMMMLETVRDSLKGIDALVVGASTIVGRPMAVELLNAGATVTVCHRFSHDLETLVSRADLVIVAVGKPNLVKGEWIKKGAIVIDVGVNRLEDGSLCGDVEFEVAKTRAAWISPVPGGVGPMTVTTLMKNTLEAANELSKLQNNS